MTVSTACSPAHASHPAPSKNAFLTAINKTTSALKSAFHLREATAPSSLDGISLSSSLGGITLGIALVAIACASIFVVVAEQELSPSATVFDRLLVAAIAFGLWHRFHKPVASPIESNTLASDETSPLSRLGCERDMEANFSNQSQASLFSARYLTAVEWRDVLLFLVAGGSFAASLACSALSLTQTSVANSALLNNMMPIFTTLGAWLLLGQTFSLRFVMGLLVAIAGVMAIGVQDLHIASNQLIGDAIALLAAILLAATILSVEQLRTKFSTPIIMMGICGIGSVAIGPVVLFNSDSLIPTCWPSQLAIVALALICQVIGHGLLTYSLRQFSSGLVSVSMLAVPVISAVLATVLFSQQLSLVNWCAFSVVLAGIYLAISARNVDALTQPEEVN